MYLKIAVCEDNEEDCKALSSMIRRHLNISNIKADITLFSCGEDFLTAHSNNPFDIVFMDIYLSGINGTKAAAIARSHSSIQTVFTTASQEHAIEAFRLNASHYLTKPLAYEDVAEAMERCFSTTGAAATRYLEVKTLRSTMSIPTDHIVYIEVFNKVCLIHTEKNDFQTYSSLDAIFELLDNNTFMRAQRSFIVNMNFIDSFYFDHITLSDGTDIVLSRNNRGELKEQYQQFLFDLARREGI